MNKHSEYLFISGCPRSGTTAMVNFLNKLPGVAVAHERYKFLASRRRYDCFGPELFQPRRLLDPQKQETNVLPDRSEAAKRRYELLSQKFTDGVTIVGDKYPHYFEMYEELATRFERARFLFLLRDVFQVANSYLKRQLNPGDSWKKGIGSAVADWNASIESTLSFMRGNNAPLLGIAYEHFFSGKKDELTRLSEFLSLEPQICSPAYEQICKGWESRSKRLDLSEKEIELVERSVDWNNYSKLCDLLELELRHAR